MKRSNQCKVSLLVLCTLLVICNFVSGYYDDSHDTKGEKEEAKPQAVIAHLADAKKYDIDGGKCSIYPDCPTGRLSCARVTQNGRYPKTGKKVNAVCTESIYVISGSLSITLNEKTENIETGDVVYIVPGTAYTIEGKAEVFVFIEPKWDGKQNTPAP